MDSNSRIQIFGVNIDPVTVEDVHNYIAGIIDQNGHELILNVNIHCLNLAFERPWLRDFLNRAGLLYCDGAGVILAARLLGHRIPERITYADWMWQLSGFVAAKGYSMYFLGAHPGIAERAQARLQQRFPNLSVLGTHHGYFNKESTSAENLSVVEQINAVRPDILVTGLGQPMQERWLYENWNNVDARIALTGGAVFDYVSGNLRRGPRWMTDNGFEWLARLVVEPKRLWRRYVIGNPLFYWRFLRTELMSGSQPRWSKHT
ncbi:MAG: WecB/TagA/CpsF family glycosyltransferase [Caldilineaceae bacterium]|nr:WecB/TagA/CpsF family glycosyltransferase [Caldilineaceae bacterium]